MHALFVGMTESGKTSLAKIMAKEIKEQGYNVIVLDPLMDEWPCDYITREADEFLEVAKTNTQCLCVIDEAGESVGHFDKQRHWLATRGRHFGHTCFFLAQRAQMISPNVRDQCGVAYIFRVSNDDSKILANEYGYDELKKLNNLAQFEFYVCGRFKGIQKYRLDISSGTCLHLRGEQCIS